MPAPRPLVLSALSGLVLALAAAPMLPLWAQSRVSVPGAAGGPGAGALPGALVPAGRDWLAVGRMDIARRGFCTVTLIAQDRALTAAHCLVDGVTGRPHPLGDLQVRLGYRNDRAAATRGVVEVLTPRRSGGAGGDGAGGGAGGGGARPVDGDLQQIADDLAILMLDQSVRMAQLTPLAVSGGQAGDGQVLSVVSYAQERSEAAALQDDCILIARRADGAMVLDCNVDHGSSGAPVMEMRGGEPRIVAVISARAEMQLDGFPNAIVALAAPVDGVAGRTLMRAAAQMPGAQAQDAGGGDQGVQIRRPGAEAPGGGARFVRPGSATAPVIR
jgi:protease YdgD